MSGHAGRNETVSSSCAGNRPCRGVVNDGTMVQQPILELRCAFSEIMAFSRQFAVCLRAEGRCKLPTQLGCAQQMLRHRLILPAAVLSFPNMRIVFHRPILSFCLPIYRRFL